MTCIYQPEELRVDLAMHQRWPITMCGNPKKDNSTDSSPQLTFRFT